MHSHCPHGLRSTLLLICECFENIAQRIAKHELHALLAKVAWWSADADAAGRLCSFPSPIAALIFDYASPWMQLLHALANRARD